MNNGNDYQNNNYGEYQDIIEDYENSCMIIKKIEEQIYQQYNKNDNNSQKQYQKCYLIEQKDYDIFKDIIFYTNFKENIQEYRDNLSIQLTMLISEGKELKKERLQNKTVKSINELYNLLKQNKEYILMNAELSKEIMQNTEEYLCFYTCNSSELLVYINGEKLRFSPNNNRISINLLKDNYINNVNEQNIQKEGNNIVDNNDNLVNNENENYFGDDNHSMKLIDWIEQYYLLEKEFLNSLSKKEKEYNKEKKYGYLILTNKFYEWKKKLNYDMIKYLLDKKLNENNYSSINEEKHVIKEFLKDKKVEKIKLESLNFKSIYELKGYNRNHDFILINSELFKLINEKEEKENEVTYVLKDEKKIELFINDESYPFFRFGNFIYSFTNFNLYLLIKIYLFQNEIFKTKRSAYIYIFRKEFMQKYKDIFEYEKLESIIKENKFDNKQINDFIENIPEFYTNSLKEKLVDKVNLFPLDENNIEIKEIKSNEDIIFNYIQEFDKIILDGYSIINFCKINEIVDNRKIIIRVGLFFIKDKVLIIFKNEEKNKVYGQLGMISELNNNYIFLVDYLISIKEYKVEKKDMTINILDDFLKDEKNIDNFYQGIYGEKSKISFEYKISEEIILYILNLKVNNENYVSQIEYGNNEYLNPFNNNNVVNNNKNEKGIIEKNNENDNKDDKMEEEINYYLQDNNAAKNNQENEKNIMNENNPNDNNIQSNYQNNPFFKIPEQNINENYNDINYLNNNQNYQNNNLAEYNINEKNHQQQNKIGENNNQYEYNNNETKLFLEKSNSFDNLNGLNNYAQQNTNYNNLNNNTNFNNINNNPINININISQNIPIDINFNNNINNNN